VRRPSLASLLARIVLAAGLLIVATAAQAARQSAVVIDANSGKILYADDIDAARYPASLTKMMTLYMTFEALASGKISKSTRIPVSRHAASQAPSKLGLKPGQTITVETAIYALVTKSANDAACALGEFLGGSEAGFARKMTAKARALGMSRTTFRNASGLPDPAQVTTARDMARLGIALRQNFPGYFKVFATRSFTYGKRRMANHNKLLGRVSGVDGIKTGYTRASGFNLVTSAGAGKKRIVAVVMGGQTGKARDAKMARLVQTYLPKASGKGGNALAALNTAEPTVAAVAEAPITGLAEDQARAVAAVKPAKRVAKAEPTPVAEEAPAVDPITTASVPRTGWAIQVASMPDSAAARAFLEKVAAQGGKVLAGAEPYTETFDKNGVTYYRARFGGFSGKQAAWKACEGLKRANVACYAVQP